MKLIVRGPLFFLILAMASAPAGLHALTDAETKVGRDLAKRSADSIVGIEMVVTVKMTMGDRAAPPRENKIDINGTVLDSSGLTVTSLAAIDPRVQFEAMRGMMGANGTRMEISETDYKEVRLRLSDGTEVPARVVLKDGDLDLAFIAPDPEAATAKREFIPVKLDTPAEGAVLNTYFVISRAPKVLQRVPLVRPSLVAGIVEKPRLMFLMTDQQLGCPVFDQQGRILGVFVQNLSGGRPSGLVVLPAADVAEIAKQAALEAAKPPAPKPVVVETPAPEAKPETPAAK
jgi:hypothetical protein